MDVVYQLVVALHLLGMAAVVGGFLVRLRTGPGTAIEVMMWGARAQVLTGLLLVGLAEGVLDYDLDRAKVGVKLVVALLVAGAAETAAARQRRGAQDAAQPAMAAGLLGVLNVLVATLW